MSNHSTTQREFKPHTLFPLKSDLSVPSCVCLGRCGGDFSPQVIRRSIHTTSEIRLWVCVIS